MAAAAFAACATGKLRAAFVGELRRVARKLLLTCDSDTLALASRKVAAISARGLLKGGRTHSPPPFSPPQIIMPYGLYISAEGASAQTTRLEALSNNLANAGTSGFKRDLALFQARYAEQTSRGMDTPGSGSINDLGGGVEVRETATDFATGPMKPTGTATDVAIPGEGFFMVRRGEETLLTRSGNFRMWNDGSLQTQDGYPVLSSDGQPIALDPTLPWQISDAGQISQSGSLIPLGLVKPQAPGDLAKAGENLFRPLAETQPIPDDQRRVLTGTLEMSSVKPTLEMMDLITTSRAFEANVNMIRHQDQMMSTLIGRLMRTNA